MWKKFILALFCSNITLVAGDIDVTKELRIHQLMPRDHFVTTLPIDPALPKNFIVAGFDGRIDLYEGVFWGPEKVVKEFCKYPYFPSEPIIYISIARGTVQTEYGHLNDKEIKKDLALMAKEIRFGKWGDIPYCIIHANQNGEKIHMAYIGTNDEVGSVLLLSLKWPFARGGEEKGLELWNRFFEETRALEGPLAIKAQGQELHEGYTIVDVAKRKIKVIAEKRKRDGEIFLACIPVDQDVKFQFQGAKEALMGMAWHYREDVMKISGLFEVGSGWVNSVETTTVLLREVDEFTHVPLVRKNNFSKIHVRSIVF